MGAKPSGVREASTATFQSRLGSDGETARQVLPSSLRRSPAPSVAAYTVVGAARGLLGVLWVAFHVLGMRSVDLVWPGLTRATTTALLVFCVMPPGIPAPVIVALSLLAILVEGGMRQSALPLALGGVLLV